jgi:hypothetical protein
VAVYLDNAGPPGSLPDLDPDAERWIATGDVFRRHANGFYEIVDRIKDIYKNSRGQTVAPQRVEQRFVNVPGIRRTFLAGDHRDHNVLLIVPDPDRPVLSRRSPDEAREYFARIVASANASLAPYERVVDFAVLDRDFDVERGELTPKGSYRRKAIEANLAPVIEGLYRSNHVELGVGPLPRAHPPLVLPGPGRPGGRHRPPAGGLRTGAPGSSLRLAPARQGASGSATWSTGSTATSSTWASSPASHGCGWATPGWWPSRRASPAGTWPWRGVSEQVRLPRGARGRTRPAPRPASPIPGSDRLGEIHELATTALFAPSAEARQAVERLGVELGRGGPRIGSAIRRRLEALAFRPEEEVRALAYRTLLLDVPLIDYDKVFPAFIESGRSYLTEESIAAIAAAGVESVGSRASASGSTATAPGWSGRRTPARRRQFYRLFRLLANFARAAPGPLRRRPVRVRRLGPVPLDPHAGPGRARHFDDLTRWHEARLRTELPEGRAQGARPAGQGGLRVRDRPGRAARIEEILFDPTFLRHSINTGVQRGRLHLGCRGGDGVWVSPTSVAPAAPAVPPRDQHGGRPPLRPPPGHRRPTPSPRRHRHHPLAHRLSGHAFGTPALPRFGAWRKDLGAVTVVYVSDLTAWERIREMASRRDVHDATATRDALRKLYVRAMATFFRAWEQSGYRIVPGAVTPHNVALPDADFQEGTAILSLAGWRPYDGPLSLVRPMVRTFYRLTAAHYPQTREALRLSWLLDAAMEALGSDAAIPFLGDLERELDGTGGSPELEGLLAELDAYRAALAAGRHVPLPVLSAIDRYGHWERMNPAASPEAREETVVQMLQVYRFDRFDDALRYHLYRHTYFRHADPAIAAAFDRITRRRLPETDGTTDEARRLEDLSALQGLLGDPADRAVFSRMVFPHAQRTQKLELFALDGDGERVGVRSRITDDTGTAFTVREPVSPAEVGHLYHLILETSYPIRIAENDRHLVIVDDEDRTVGGLTYRWEEGDTVYVDGIVVARSLTNRGLGGALLEDFCVRTAAQGARLAKTNFFLGGLFSRHGFQVSRQWGGLVRALS